MNTRYVSVDVDVANNRGETVIWQEVTHPESIVYVQVTYKRKNTKFRSKVPLCHLEELPEIRVYDNLNEINEYYLNERDDVIKGITRDLNYILWIVNQEIKRNSDFDISELPEIYHGDKYSLISFVEDYLKREIREALNEKVLAENGYWEFEQFSKYKIYSQSSALNNLEYYLNLYPQLNFLKNKYSSKIWLLSIYLEQEGIGDIMLFDYTLQEQGVVPVMVFNYVPTFYDYLTNTFQKDLEESLRSEQIYNQIITDIDKLVLKYYR